MTLLHSILQRQLVCNQPLKKIPLDFAMESFTCHRVDEHLVRGRETAIEVPPFACAFRKDVSSGGHLLAVADEDGSVQLLDTKKYGQQSVVEEWTAHANAIFDVAWMEGEPKLLTASGDQTARLWDVERVENLAIFKGHSCSLKSVNFRENDMFVFATGARDGHVMIWDIRCNRRNGYYQPVNTIHNAHTQQVTTPQRVRKRSRRASVPQPVTDSQQSVTAVIFQGQHMVISSGAMDGNIKLWDLRRNFTTLRQRPLPYHMFPYPGIGPRKHGFSSLILDSHQSKLYASCTNDHIYMYECSVLGKNPVCTFSGHSNSTFYVKAALSPDDGYLLSGSSDSNAYIWKVSEPDAPPVLMKGHAGEVTSVAWCSVDQGKIVSCSDDNNVRIWRLNRNQGFRSKSDFIGHSERLRTNQPRSPVVTESSSSSKLLKTTTSPCQTRPIWTPPTKVHTNPRLNPLSSPAARVTAVGCSDLHRTPPKKLFINSQAKCVCASPQRGPTASPGSMDKNQWSCPASPISVSHIPTCPLSPGPSSSATGRGQSPQQLMRSWLKVTPRKRELKENAVPESRQNDSEGTLGKSSPSERLTPSPKSTALSDGSRLRFRKGLGKTLSECIVEQSVSEKSDDGNIRLEVESFPKVYEGETSPSPSPPRKRQCLLGPSNFAAENKENVILSKKSRMGENSRNKSIASDAKDKVICLSDAESHTRQIKIGLNNAIRSGKYAVELCDEKPCRDDWLTRWSKYMKVKNGIGRTDETRDGEGNIESGACRRCEEYISPEKDECDKGDAGVTFTVVKPEESILRYFKPSLSPIQEQFR